MTFDSLNKGYAKVPARFGLLQEYTWPQLFKEIEKLNAEGTHKHKLFFLARHGQGYHNVAEAKYGTKVRNVLSLVLLT